MKKFLALLLSLSMVFALSACGGKSDSTPPADTDAAETGDSTPASDFKVGFIFLHDENSTYDLSWPMTAATSSLPTPSVMRITSFRPLRRSLRFSSATPPAPVPTPRA